MASQTIEFLQKRPISTVHYPTLFYSTTFYSTLLYSILLSLLYSTLLLYCTSNSSINGVGQNDDFLKLSFPRQQQRNKMRGVWLKQLRINGVEFFPQQDLEIQGTSKGGRAKKPHFFPGTQNDPIKTIITFVVLRVVRFPLQLSNFLVSFKSSSGQRSRR